MIFNLLNRTKQKQQGQSSEREYDLMKTLTLDVEGLNDEQIALAREFIELMKKTKQKRNAYANLREILAKRKKTNISEEEANEIAGEAIAWARSRS